MAILKIARIGHPVLRQKAAAVGDPTAPEIRLLVADMLDTLADAHGVGLAAPQVHQSLRLIVFFVPVAREADERYRDAGLDNDTEEVPLTVLINPETEVIGNETAAAYEGCLSIPHMTGEVHRPTRIRYRGLDLNGNAIEREAEGFHARVVQHECDHLDGILYPQQMDDLSTFGYNDEMTNRCRETDSRKDLE